MSDTIFGQIIRKEIPAQIVYEDEYVIAFLDIFPVNQGHTLLVPKAPAVNMTESTLDDLTHVLRVAKQIAPAILASVGATDFNFSTNNGANAGQVILQTHFHLIPRFENDGHISWGHTEASQEELARLAEEIRARL